MKTDEQSLVCVKAATTVLGDKWTPQLLCIFAEENTVRFCQLQEEVGGINPRTLSARLSALEQHEIIQSFLRAVVAAATTASPKRVVISSQFLPAWQTGGQNTL